MVSENAPDNILVKIQTKRQVDLLCDPGAAEPRVAPLHGYNCIDDFFRRPFRTWFSQFPGGVKKPVFSFPECCMESQERLGLDDDGYSRDTPRIEKC